MLGRSNRKLKGPEAGASLPGLCRDPEGARVAGAAKVAERGAEGELGDTTRPSPVGTCSGRGEDAGCLST